MSRVKKVPAGPIPNMLKEANSTRPGPTFMQIDLANAITIGAALLGLLAALIKIIRDQDMKRIDALEKTAGQLKDAFAVIASLQQNINSTAKSLEDLEERIGDLMEHQKETNERISSSLETIRESLADVRETVAGFGTTYVSRRLYDYDRQDGHKK